MDDLAPLGQPGFNINANQGGNIVATMIALIVLSTVSVLLRLLSRRVAGAGYWWDDVLIGTALLLALAPPICNIIAVQHYGFGKHVWTLGGEMMNDTRQTYVLLWVFQLFFCLATGTIKLSILAFYRRIFRAPELQKALSIFTYVVVLFMIGSVMVSIFQCAPIEKFWNTDVAGYCLDPYQNLLVSGSVNTALDFVIVILPVPLLWRLRTSVRQRFVLTGIFYLAGFVCIVSIIRLVVYIKNNPGDVTWNSTEVTIWSAVEPCVGIISGCIPSFRPLITRQCLIRSAIYGAKATNPPVLDSKSSNLPWVKHHYRMDDYDVEVERPGNYGSGTTYEGIAFSTNNIMQKDGPIKDFRVEEVEVPFGNIQVKTDIRWSWTDRLDYDSRLY